MSRKPNHVLNARLAAFAALLALAASAQALTPAGASAVAPNPIAGGCQPVPFVGAVWNGSEFCPFKESGGEVITVESWLNPCVRNPSLCMPFTPGGGREPLRVGDGSGGPGQGSGAGKRAEAPKKAKDEKWEVPENPSRAQCTSFKDRLFLSEGERSRLSELEQQALDRSIRLTRLGQLNQELVPQRAQLRRELRVLRLHSKPDPGVRSEREAALRDVDREIATVLDQARLILNAQIKSEPELERLWRKGVTDAAALRKRCLAFYGEDY